MKILCVCTGNTCRSPMLMTLLRAASARLAEQRAEQEQLTEDILSLERPLLEVESAGTAALSGEPASSYARTCMELRGLDLSDHLSRHIEEVDLPSFDQILCMTSSHAAALRTRGVPAKKLTVVNAEAGGVPDPFGGNLNQYETCANVLDQVARNLAKEAAHRRRI